MALAIGAWVKKTVWAVLASYGVLLIGIPMVVQALSWAGAAIFFAGELKKVMTPQVSAGSGASFTDAFSTMVHPSPWQMWSMGVSRAVLVGTIIGGWYMLRAGLRAAR
jgi:hypothetical protein